jgi:transposase
LTAAGWRCEVAAPSKLQRPAGNRVKTDARDAMHLARLLRLDEIVPVRVPTGAEEAARDLVRAREAARQDLMRARHRVSKLLLRHGIVYSGGKAWTQGHDRWLRQQRFDSAPSQVAFDDAYDTVVLTTARRDRLDEKISALAIDSEFTELARRLSCLRGIATLTGFALAVFGKLPPLRSSFFPKRALACGSTR